MSKNVSNISNVLNYFRALDASGKNPQKIDTVLECNMLGQFLNGSCIYGTKYENLGINDKNTKQVLVTINLTKLQTKKQNYVGYTQE